MNNFESTLNLPKTKFSMRGNLKELEPKILSFWEKNNLYFLIKEIKKGKKNFVLHDGPPYANGNIHLGHALNKILKDIIIKSKNLSGFNSFYTPGWDCHGLPIEHKVEEIIRKYNIKITSRKFRLECRKYAHKQIEIQKKMFVRLGILADWKNPYLTMDYKTESNIIRTLSEIVKKNYLYQNIKPVYWCFDCKSALAESEIEYYNKKSLSIYFMFSAVNKNYIFSKFKINKLLNNVSIVVWTTTPWTIPFNRAIALHSKYNYQLIEIKNQLLIIAESLVKNVMKKIGISKWKILGSIKGKNLEGIKFFHPFLDFNIPIVMGKHIDLKMGTGAVHIAPAHGLEDYKIGIKYNLEITNLVDENGFFESNIHLDLNKKHVFSINKIIINILYIKSKLLYNQEINHSYPHCWRHKNPVIFRSTPQWFINIEKYNLKNRALLAIKKVKWIPCSSKNKMISMLEKRPDWCISRQRNWGVPITLFIHKKTKKIHPKMSIFIEKIAKKIESKGIQFWWDLNIKDFLPKEYDNYEKVTDTLDVWFDSGSTHFSILNYRKEYLGLNSDMYLEGSDQYRGWFMSSLILSIAIKNTAPYKEVLTHGFIVDNEGKKMSKSTHNFIKIENILDKFGADIIRIWVSFSDYTKEISVSDEVFKRASDIYRRIRNTARFLLSNLNDFNPNIHFIKKNKMIILDQWAIHRTKITQKKIIEAYKKYNFQKVIKYIMQFCSVEMGSCYLEIIKDRLYTHKKNSFSRLSAQFTLYNILEALVRWIAPIISFTADEIWNHLKNIKLREKHVFAAEWFKNLFYLSEKQNMNNNFWSEMLQIRNEVNKVIENARICHLIKSSLEAEIILFVDDNLLKKLIILNDELHFFLLVSKVKILKYNFANSKAYKSNIIHNLKIMLYKIKGEKCLRCWHYSKNIQYHNLYKNLCKRCILNVTGVGEKRKFI